MHQSKDSVKAHLVKTLAILGHPAHELQALGWFQKWQPETILLTDGSGSDGKNRTNHTSNNLQAAGLHLDKIDLSITCPDKEFYQSVRHQSLPFFRHRFDFLVSKLRQGNFRRVLCDGFEFYNSTHDLCRELARSACNFVRSRDNVSIDCFEIPLTRKRSHHPDDQTLRLSPSILKLKMNLASQYHHEEHPSIQEAIDDLTEKYGLDSFREERICRIPPLEQGIESPSETPFYETFGIQRVKQGVYNSVITWHSHIKPLIEHFHRWSVESRDLRCAS